MNKLILPSIIGAVGILAILAATILGFLVIPNVIDNQIEEVNLKKQRSFIIIAKGDYKFDNFVACFRKFD